MKRALIIAINDYPDNRGGRIPKLDGCENDGELLRLTLAKYGFNINNGNDVKTLANHHATRDVILRELKSFLEKTTEIPEDGKDADVLVVSFSGHGVQVHGGSRYVEGLLAYIDKNKYAQAQTKDAAEDEALIYDFELRRLLRQHKNKNVVLFLDSCHSGGMSRDVKKERPETTRGITLMRTLDSTATADAQIAGPYVNWTDPTYWTDHVFLTACSPVQLEGEMVCADANARQLGLSGPKTLGRLTYFLCASLQEKLGDTMMTWRTLHASIISKVRNYENRNMLELQQDHTASYPLLIGMARRLVFRAEEVLEDNHFDAFKCVEQVASSSKAQYDICGGVLHGISLDSEWLLYSERSPAAVALKARTIDVGPSLSVLQIDNLDYKDKNATCEKIAKLSCRYTAKLADLFEIDESAKQLSDAVTLVYAADRLPYKVAMDIQYQLREKDHPQRILFKNGDIDAFLRNVEMLSWHNYQLFATREAVEKLSQNRSTTPFSFTDVEITWWFSLDASRPQANWEKLRIMDAVTPIKVPDWKTYGFRVEIKNNISRTIHYAIATFGTEKQIQDISPDAYSSIEATDSVALWNTTDNIGKFKPDELRFPDGTTGVSETFRFAFCSLPISFKEIEQTEIPFSDETMAANHGEEAASTSRVSNRPKKQVKSTTGWLMADVVITYDS